MDAALWAVAARRPWGAVRQQRLQVGDGQWCKAEPLFFLAHEQELFKNLCVELQVHPAPPSCVTSFYVPANLLPSSWSCVVMRL